VVGGVESLTIAGKRYWFGFSYRADTVLSPLIDDARVMAQFGSDYLLQTTGAQPPEYWEGLVKTAVDLSDLDSDPGARDFTGHELSDVLLEIEAAKREHRPARLTLPAHLLYLTDATLKFIEDRRGPFPCAGKWERAIKALDSQGYCLDGALKVVSGRADPPPGTDYEDALAIVADYVDYWRRNAPENWRTLLLSG
jgi:hypothetical protein